MSILELLNDLPESEFHLLEDKSLEFYRKGNYEKASRYLIGCCVYGNSSDAEGYLFDIDQTIEHCFGYPERFTEVELTYCKNILIPKIIDKWMAGWDLKEPDC